ncbi:MAG: hypothetical protein GY950_27615, partial [bacterium]|nr:hypothetical protein [bacterium]
MRNRIFTFVSIFVLALGLTAHLVAADANRRPVDQWLVLGPAAVPAMEADLLKNEEGLLKFNHIPVRDLQPVKGRKVTWSGGSTLSWQTMKRFFPNDRTPQIYYLATYLEPTRWLQTKLVIDKGEF